MIAECCLTPNMTRSEKEHRAPVTRAMKAKTNHGNLSVLEAFMSAYCHRAMKNKVRTGLIATGESIELTYNNYVNGISST